MVTSKLEHLDNATRSKIRSTQILTSLPQIISELVQNSLDAGSKNIETGINYNDWTCWVRDDGLGINKDGLHLIAQGMEGGRYSSSKSYSPVSLDHLSTFGFRGEALASAADLSCIEISSRTARSKESWSIILKGGEKLYYGPSLRWRREGAGTTVSIRDAFFNLPIRRLSHPSSARTLELVRRELETFALVFPHVTFTLTDTSKENCDGTDRCRVVTIPKTSSSLSTFRHLYGRALVEHADIIDVQSGSMRLEGFLSLIGSHSKSRQFLYVNRHILDTCELHRLIDQCFSSSTFAKRALDESGELTSPRPGTRRSPRKGESRPAYVLNLTVPPREIDNCLEPAKAAVHFQNQDAVASFLAEVIQSFLARHGFRVTRTSNSSNDPVNPSSKRRKVDADDLSYTDVLEISNPPIPTSTRSIDKRSKMKDLFIQEPLLENEGEELTWVDPNTGRTYLVDPRTGNSYFQDQRHEDLDNSGSRLHVWRRTIVDTRWLDRLQCPSQHSHEGEKEMPDWIKQALESNDTFATTERAVPRLPSSKNTIGGVNITRRIPWTKHIDQNFCTLSQSLGGIGTAPSCSFSKEGLAGVQVLEQVDHKFIACLINDNNAISLSDDEDLSEDHEESAGSRTLVLVDQHAADERVRVERFLRSLCLGYLDRDGVGVERRTLDPPAPVLLTKFERDRLMASARMKKAFGDWGLDLVEVRPVDESRGEYESDEGYGMVYCSSVPEVVADKLVAGSGGDLREVVKGYLARLEAENLDDSCEEHRQAVQEAYVTAADANEFAWLKALRHCPRELIELVNSRACRGAIMFNDQLSSEQCKRLLRQLSMTAFPFQCAHGRPSVVPLTTIHPRRDTEDSGRSQTHPRAVDWGGLS